MCGLPTETDDDVLQIADLAKRVIATGREVSRAAATSAARCRIGGFVPKPHTPFQWAAQLDHEVIDARLAKLRDAIRSDRRYGKAIGFRYHDGKPGIDRGPAVPRRPPRRHGDPRRVGGRRPLRRLERALLLRPLVASAAPPRRWPASRSTSTGTPRASASCTEVLPWDHLDAGLDKDWLWEDWQDALSEVEVEDCRWTPCFDCGVCPQMGTEIQIGPTGRTLLPLTVVPAAGA